MQTHFFIRCEIFANTTRISSIRCIVQLEESTHCPKNILNMISAEKREIRSGCCASQLVAYLAGECNTYCSINPFKVKRAVCIGLWFIMCVIIRFRLGWSEIAAILFEQYVNGNFPLPIMVLILS